jgi:hypothetical protein
MILLDLGLPDLSGEDLLRQLRQMPETAQAPVLIVSGRRERADRLRKERPADVAGILLKPVGATQLCQAVRTALRAATSDRPPQPAQAREAFHRRELIRHLIVDGPDRLAFHVYRRLSLDRMTAPPTGLVEALSWREIADWAVLEGLLTETQAELLRGGSADSSRKAGQAPAPAGGHGP